MLNFSKIKVVLIYLLLLILTFFSFLNLQKDNFLDKKVNLGLDLQGGSYLLLEIDTEPLINERLQSKVIPIKKFLNKNSITFDNFIVNKKAITFKINSNKHSNF